MYGAVGRPSQWWKKQNQWPANPERTHPTQGNLENGESATCWRTVQVVMLTMYSTLYFFRSDKDQRFAYYGVPVKYGTNHFDFMPHIGTIVAKPRMVLTVSRQHLGEFTTEHKRHFRAPAFVVCLHIFPLSVAKLAEGGENRTPYVTCTNSTVVSKQHKMYCMLLEQKNIR